MTSPLDLSLAYADKRALARAFSWLTRIGAAPKFGSRPIGWYQTHQCAAIDFLRGQGAGRARLHKGIIQTRYGRCWKNICRPGQLFEIANKKSRE